MPLLAARDSALRAIYATVTPNAPNGLGTQEVAWRPDGRALAARLTLIDPQDGLDHHIRLYDCATGRQITALRPFVQAGDVVGILFLARWSPDGARLLLYDAAAVGPEGIITIYGPGVLHP